MIRTLIKPHEFWHPRIFEAPFYLYLGWQCVFNRLAVTHLAKANYALDHGEIGIGSKFHTQNQFPQQQFLATQLLDAELSAAQRLQCIESFAAAHGFPLILKPDIGMVGKGILRLKSLEEAALRVGELEGNYLLQQYCNLPEEYGVFYIRSRGQSLITGINRKHFPTVTGDGAATILQLSRAHSRYSEHWATFLQYQDLNHVPAAGEVVRLSFIGSHTMGCMFTDDSHLASAALRRAIFDICDAQPGFNYGRLDIKVESQQALQAGAFRVIEINGISSLPTHMFDPGYSLRDSYRVFFKHGKYLAQVASEHRNRDMPLMRWWRVASKVKQNQAALERQHLRLKSGGGEH